MANDAWYKFNGVELVNLSRTTQLAEAMGISSLVLRSASYQWVEDALGGSGYGDVTNAPWYDAGYAASSEFAGIVPLTVGGLDDSTLESTPIEYITDGGNSGRPRNATLPVVWNVIIVAKTERGAEYGKRWLDRQLRDSGSQVLCVGAFLEYFRFKDDAPIHAHRRDVRLTRGTSVTKKLSRNCSALWWTTFTMTAADPYEYGETQSSISELGGSVTGPGLISSGDLVLTQEDCPVYDYTPIYDPLYPALVPSPTSPSFYPAGWNITPGMTFDRFWARVSPVEPSDLRLVPLIDLETDVDARMVRISIWPSDADTDTQCDPLFSAVVSYLPANVQFFLDGKEKAAYVWDGSSPAVRRTDSLVFSPEANPVEWTAFNDPTNLLVTLDVFSDSDGYEGDGSVRASVSFIPKSD